MELQLFVDPAPYLVAYLTRRFQDHSSVKLPELKTSAYRANGIELPLLVIGYDSSEEVDARSALFSVILEMVYFPIERSRTDDDSFLEFDDTLPMQLQHLYHLMLEFCEDAAAMASDPFRVVLAKQGALGTRPELDDAGNTSFTITQEFQAYWQPPGA